jgi:uncharacterized protein with GYD domain
MPTFVLMTKLSPDVMGDPRGLEAVGKDWLKHVEKHCPKVKWVAHYALLGRYDFMDIYEAPDFETAHKVSYISRAQGALAAESWQAVPYERYVKLVENLK